jgi:hypothetical protein
VPGAADQGLEQLQVGVDVVDDENLERSPRAAGAVAGAQTPSGLGRARRLDRLEREHEREGAAARARSRRRSAAHQLHQPAADGEAEARAAEAAVGVVLGLAEHLEQPRDAGWVDPDAGVADREAHGRGPAPGARSTRG